MKHSVTSVLLIFCIFAGSNGCGDGRKLEMSPQSTAIAKVEYWPESETRRFVVYFTRNPSRGYEFKGLEPETWEAWVQSGSKGRFYHSVIRPEPKYKLR